MSVTMPVRAGLFVDGGPPCLLGSRCGSCGLPHFPRHESCPYCASDDVRPAEFFGPARLWAWTSVTAAPPGYRGEVPFGFGVVELADGIRVVTRLTEADPSRLRLGQAMELVIVPLCDDEEGGHVLTYAFTPSS